MSYRIGIHEAAVRAIRRVAREQIDRASAELTDPKAEPAEAIHSARRRFKKIRSILRMARSALGPAYSAENAWYRDLGRDLSSLRDVVMLVEALDSLAPKNSKSKKASPWPAIRAALAERRDRVAGETGNPRVAMRRLAGKLAPAKRRIAAWPMSGVDPAALAGGWRRSFAQGRRALRQVLEKPDEERFHELRKRSKDLWQQAQLLRDVWPSDLPSHRAELEKAADLLGQSNDLAVLHRSAKEIAGQIDCKAEFASLLTRIIARREALLTEALTLATEIFEAKPRAVAERLEAHWRAKSAKKP